MKKILSFILLILLVACSSTNDSNAVNEVDIRPQLLLQQHLLQ